MFPKWAYGFWQCRERYHTQKEILDVGMEFRKRKLPVDALVQDWQYWGKYGWNAMKFDESNYPDPKGMMEQFHALDEHVPISVWSRFGEDSDVYKRMSAKSLLVAGTPWVDFFNPEAQSTFSDRAQQRALRLRDGWMVDGRVRAGVRHSQRPPDISGQRRVGAQRLSSLCYESDL